MLLGKGTGSSGGYGGEAHGGFCGLGIVGKVIYCASCSGQFHADIACVDLDIIACFLKENTGALQYHCCRCRDVSGGTRESVPLQSGMMLAFEHLFKVVGALTRRIGKITDKPAKVNWSAREQVASSRANPRYILYPCESVVPTKKEKIKGF